MPKNKKLTAEGALRVKVYEVLERAVDEGISYGWSHAHKHTDAPGPESIREEILRAVMGSICEIFVFPETNE